MYSETKWKQRIETLLDQEMKIVYEIIVWFAVELIELIQINIPTQNSEAVINLNLANQFYSHPIHGVP